MVTYHPLSVRTSLILLCIIENDVCSTSPTYLLRVNLERVLPVDLLIDSIGYVRRAQHKQIVYIITQNIRTHSNILYTHIICTHFVVSSSCRSPTGYTLTHILCCTYYIVYEIMAIVRNRYLNTRLSRICGKSRV